MAGPRDYSASMSAPLPYNEAWEPRSSAKSMAGAGRHRHRKLQQPQESFRTEVTPSSAGDTLGCRPLVPHAPQEYSSMPPTGSGPAQHVHTSALSDNHSCGADRKDSCFSRTFEPVRDSDHPLSEAPHPGRLSACAASADQQQGPFPSTSAGMLHTFQTPRVVSKSGKATASVHNGDSGLTQQSHATWVADSIRQSVTGALDQAMEALEAELARKLPGKLQPDKRTRRSSEGGVRQGALEPIGFQVPTEKVDYRLDDIARMQVNEFGSDGGDL